MTALNGIEGAVRMRDLVLLAISVDQDAWCQRHPSPALLHKPEDSVDPEDEGMDFYTVVADQSTLGGTLRGQVDQGWLAIPVQKRSTGTYAAQISVGRTRNVDLSLPFAGLSKFHAYFQNDGAGNWMLTDFGSTNGTYVRDLRLPPKTPRALEDGDVVRFGDHAFRFVMPPTLHTLLRQIH